MGTGVKLRTASAINHAMVTPANPPQADSIEDSTRNWFMMSCRRAPTDFRIPISRVLSDTTANMIFMITTPPTTINTLTTPTAAPAIAPVN